MNNNNDHTVNYERRHDENDQRRRQCVLHLFSRLHIFFSFGSFVVFFYIYLHMKYHSSDVLAARLEWVFVYVQLAEGRQCWAAENERYTRWGQKLADNLLVTAWIEIEQWGIFLASLLTLTVYFHRIYVGVCQFTDHSRRQFLWCHCRFSQLIFTQIKDRLTQWRFLSISCHSKIPIFSIRRSQQITR